MPRSRLSFETRPELVRFVVGSGLLVLLVAPIWPVLFAGQDIGRPAPSVATDGTAAGESQSQRSGTSINIPAVVEGNVVRAGTGEPVAGAVVTLASLDLDTAQRALGATLGRRSRTTADADGRFAMEVPAGRYALNVEHTGLFPIASQGEVDLSVTLAPGQRMDGVVVQLQPGASIAGSVLDPDGRAVTGIVVTASQSIYGEGQRWLKPCLSAGGAGTRDITDENGRYTLSGLPAGEYYVAVMEDRGSTCNSPTFYPGAHQLTAAVPVRVTAGGEVGGIDIQLLPETEHHRIFLRMEPQDDEDSRSTYVRLVRDEVGMGGIILVDGRLETLLEEVEPGRFATGLLPDGTYHLQVKAERSIARWNVNIVDRDIDLGDVEFEPPVPIQGSIRPVPTFSGTVRYEDLWVILEPVGYASLASRKLMRVQSSGEFTGEDDPVTGLRDITPGRYRIRVTGLSSDSYVTHIQYGFQDVVFQDFAEVSASSGRSQFDIQVDGPAGSVQGVVRDQSGAVGSNARVVLIPAAERRARLGLFQWVVADQNGQFAFDRIIPGSYGVMAWSYIADGAWLDQSVLRQYETRFRSVRVEMGDREVVEVVVD